MVCVPAGWAQIASRELFRSTALPGYCRAGQQRPWRPSILTVTAADISFGGMWKFCWWKPEPLFTLNSKSASEPQNQWKYLQSSKTFETFYKPVMFWCFVTSLMVRTRLWSIRYDIIISVTSSFQGVVMTVHQVQSSLSNSMSIH